jgi:putative ABC transport system ATP-binding protein
MAPFSLDTHCQTLSGGERQRVYIAIFLSFNAEVLMLDEPTSALDEMTSRKLFENLKQYMHKMQHTLIVVSHDARLIETFADSVIELTDTMTKVSADVNAAADAFASLQ